MYRRNEFLEEERKYIHEQVLFEVGYIAEARFKEMKVGGYS